jgi:YD repeat-containing protein
MNNRWLQVIVVLGVLLSPWIAPFGWGVIPPPILNSKITDESGTYYLGTYNEYDDCESNDRWQDPWSYYEDECGPQISGCGELCTSYVAFGTWYYQNCLLDGPSDFDMDTAPLYLDSCSVAYGDDPPSPINIQAKLFPIQGLDALRYIPVEVSRTARLPVASARYGISVEVNQSPPSDTVVGALFWITAIYDSSVFDVRVNCWEHLYYDPSALYSSQPYAAMENSSQAQFFATSSIRPHFSTGVDTELWAQLFYDAVVTDGWYTWYNHNMELPSAQPMMFTDYAPRLGCLSSTELRRGSLPLTPDYVTVRLKDGHRLEDLGGRKVELILHTLSWIGDKYWCSPSGDAFHYSRTSQVLVGADLDGKTNDDWSTQPAELKDECIPPSFSKTDVGSAEVDVIGAKVVNDLNVELPSMRVGQNRGKVTRTLATTLANDLVYYPFGYGGIFTEYLFPCFAGGFTVINLNGVWCCVKDIPGWEVADWAYNPTTGSVPFGIRDNDTKQVYFYYTTDNDDDEAVLGVDYIYSPAKLVEVDTPDLTQVLREYQYLDDDITQPVIYQVDTDSNYIQYLYEPVNNGNGNDLKVTLSGNNEREIAATFAAWPTIPDDLGSCPLLSCTIGSGNSWRLYEWYQPGTTPKPYDGKLKTVKDADGHALAAFEYDETTGRPTKRTRGTPAQTVVEYVYNQTPPEPGEPLSNSTMDAKFYVDDGTGEHYQLVRRTFNPQGLVIQMEEFQELQEDGSENGPTSITTFDYCDSLPEGLDWNQTYLFYQFLSASYTWVGRCQIKTLPANQSSLPIAEYTQYDASAGWNILQTFLAPPPSIDENGAKVEPAEEDRYNWMAYGPYGNYDGAYLPSGRTDKSRSTNTPDLNNAQIAYSYENGHLDWQLDAEVTGVDSETTQMEQTWTYAPFDPDYPNDIDYRKVKTHMCSSPNGAAVTGYEYDTAGNMAHKYEGSASDVWSEEPEYILTWDYYYNAFGQKTVEVDPDCYAHQTDYETDTGLISGTCVFDPMDSNGLVVQQTKYEYANGMLWKIHVADNPGPFAFDNPAAWITTTYSYDTYGRLSSKVVNNLTTSYEYDRQDRLVKVTWPDDRWKEITRDGRGQITQIQCGKGSTTLTSTYTYDDAGNLTVRTTEGCPQCGKRTEYQYDPYSRRTAEIRREVTQ